MQDTSSKTVTRRYIRSSSFKMALLFTVLLGLSAALLGYYLYDFGQRDMPPADIRAWMESYNRLKWLSAGIMALMLAVVAVSFVISMFVVSRINLIGGTARHIMETGDLSRRISIKTQWDDLSNLAQVLNVFLARIESLMQGIREISDNIAHDLRTPLTRLRHQIEELKTRDVTENDMDMVLAEVDHMLAIFHSLLRIANIEKGKRHQSFSEVELPELLQDVIELYEPLAEEKSIAIRTSLPAGLAMLGDRNLLFQLFANLLDNAIKFSPPHSEVQVVLERHGGGARVIISDSGPGIADAEHEKIFTRFYRGDASRNTPGHGLGLSLCKAILDLHQGVIQLGDNRPGLVVRLTF